MIRHIVTGLVFGAVLTAACTAGSGGHKETGSAPQTTVSAAAGTQLPSMKVDCTAYDLSYESCNKHPDDPAYGITANGTSLRYKSREQAMVVAADPKVYPLGSKILLIFKGRFASYSGIYTVADTGGAITSNRIDVFIPDRDEALAFGRQMAECIAIR